MANGNFYDEQHDYFSSPLLGGGTDPNFVELKSAPTTLGFPRTPDMTSPEQKIDAYQRASAEKQGGVYDPNTRTVTAPDLRGQKAPQGGMTASNVFIPSDPKLRINAGGGAGAAAPVRLEGNVAAHRLTGQVEDRITGVQSSKDSWDSEYQGRGAANDWISGGSSFKSREDDAIGIAAEALGQKPLERGFAGDFPQSLGGKQAQQELARRAMESPKSEQERFGVATNFMMHEGMSDEDILRESEGSIIAPATPRVSMGTNWTPPSSEGLANISAFEQENGVVPGGIPYQKNATDNIVQDLMPNLKSNVPVGQQGTLAPKDVKVKPKGKR